MNTATFWAMTINNPDENDYAIVTTGYPDYIRSLIHTSEVGEDGTPHVQAWVRLKRQQRMSFMKKLFPRGHFTPLASDEYELNTRRYVQKNDGTTNGAHIQQHNDPITDCITLLKRFASEIVDNNRSWNKEQEKRNPDKQIKPIGAERWQQHLRTLEREAVVSDPYNAKVFVSPTYARVKREYFADIFEHVVQKRDADDNPPIKQDTGRQVEWVDDDEEVAEIHFEEVSGSESDSDTESGGDTDSEGSSGDEVCE